MDHLVRVVRVVQKRKHIQVAWWVLYANVATQCHTSFLLQECCTVRGRVAGVLHKCGAMKVCCESVVKARSVAVLFSIFFFGKETVYKSLVKTYPTECTTEASLKSVGKTCDLQVC